MPDKALMRHEHALALTTEWGEHHQRGRALPSVEKLTASRQHLETAILLLDPPAPLDAEKARRALGELG